MCNLHFDSFRAVHRGSPSSVDTTLVAGTKNSVFKVLRIKDDARSEIYTAERE